MKDLIAKLQLDANFAFGAIWLHIDAQAARIAELEEQQAFGIGETYANALSRIAELEAQIAAASAPVVEQQPIGYLRQSEIDKLADHRVAGVGMMLHKEPGEGKIAVYGAPPSADTDKLREAMTAWESLRADVLHGPDGLDNDQVNIILGMIDYYTPTASTALQAPVREVPEGWQLVPKVPTKQMIAKACSDHGYPGGSRKVYELGYVSMLAAAPLPAAPVQEPKP